MDAVCSPVWIHVKRLGLETTEKPYEEPESADLTIDHDHVSQEDALKQFQSFVLGRITPMQLHVKNFTLKTTQKY